MTDYKRIAERWFEEVLSEGKMEVIDELCSPDHVEHNPLPGTDPVGLAGIREGVTRVRAAFPDIEVTVEDIVVEGDQLAARTTLRGTHEGEFFGVPATGKRIEVSRYDFVRFEDGLAVEHWGTIDSAALMEQIGPVPVVT
jgi:steroid delta-isomerase-like uncharacterized protein